MHSGHKALDISPDCADAHGLHAEEASASAEDAPGHYRNGVEAGRRALGDEFIAEATGNVWTILDTIEWDRLTPAMDSPPRYEGG